MKKKICISIGAILVATITTSCITRKEFRTVQNFARSEPETIVRLTDAIVYSYANELASMLSGESVVNGAIRKTSNTAQESLSLIGTSASTFGLTQGALKRMAFANSSIPLGQEWFQSGKRSETFFQGYTDILIAIHEYDEFNPFPSANLLTENGLKLKKKVTAHYLEALFAMNGQQSPTKIKEDSLLKLDASGTNEISNSMLPQGASRMPHYIPPVVAESEEAFEAEVDTAVTQTQIRQKVATVTRSVDALEGRAKRQGKTVDYASIMKAGGWKETDSSGCKPEDGWSGVRCVAQLVWNKPILMAAMKAAADSQHPE